MMIHYILSFFPYIPDNVKFEHEKVQPVSNNTTL